MLNELRELRGEDVSKAVSERMGDDVVLSFASLATLVQRWGEDIE